MDGRKKARIERCKRCRHRVDKHEKYAGPHGYSRFCTAPDSPPIELHDGYMEGPDENCPKGHWAGLQRIGPEDPQEWKRWNRERNREARRSRQKPDLKETVSQIADSPDINADAETALAVLVAVGAVQPWLAEEISQEVRAAT